MRPGLCRISQAVFCSYYCPPMNQSTSDITTRPLIRSPASTSCLPARPLRSVSRHGTSQANCRLSSRQSAARAQPCRSPVQRHPQSSSARDCGACRSARPLCAQCGASACVSASRSVCRRRRPAKHHPSRVPKYWHFAHAALPRRQITGDVPAFGSAVRCHVSSAGPGGSGEVPFCRVRKISLRCEEFLATTD